MRKRELTNMAEYKYGTYLSESNDSRYDKEYSPGDSTTYPGIYRCSGCGDEIGIAKNKTLPPQNEHQHSGNTSVKWKLLVRAQQK